MDLLQRVQWVQEKNNYLRLFRMKIIFKGLTKSHKKDKKLDATFIVDGRERVVPFGAKGYVDFTRLPRRTPAQMRIAELTRLAYLDRHQKRENWNDPLTPGALSRWILWEAPTVEEAEKQYRVRFDL